MEEDSTATGDRPSEAPNDGIGFGSLPREEDILLTAMEPMEATFENSSNPLNDENPATIPVESVGGAEANDVVFVVFDNEPNVSPPAVSHSMSEADLISIKDIIEQKRLQKVDPLDEVDSVSQDSSTAASSADKTASILVPSRRFRNRRKRAIGADGKFNKKFDFTHTVETRCGKRCLRRLFTRISEPGGGPGGDTDHSYFASESRIAATGTPSNSDVFGPSDSRGEHNGNFRRLLFVSRYDDSWPQTTAADAGSSSCNVVVDDPDPPKIESTSEAEDKETDDALSEFVDARLSSLNQMHSQAQQLAVSIRKILGQSNEEVEADWKEELLRLSDTLSKTKLIGRVVNLLDGMSYSNLVASGSADEWMIRKNAISHAGSLLRRCFADGISWSGLSILKWLHWRLMERLPVERCADYFLALGELYDKAPDLVLSVITSDHNADRRVVGLLITFLTDQRKTNGITPELLLQHLPPPPLPKDPILMLVSPTVKAHNDTLARGNSRCRVFYKNLFPHLGFCVEVKFTPFKKGVTVATCSDQLYAFLRDKIREVQYYHCNRPIVLVGWQTSCLIALKVALEKSIAAVVCLGFPNLTLAGPRGGEQDEILNVTCPTVFVVGQFASACSITVLEDMRQNMKSENTGLIVVGGADNDLRVNDMKLRSENLCQEVVDRCILESVDEFLDGALQKYGIGSVAGAGNASPASSGATSREGGLSEVSLSNRRRSSWFGQVSSPSMDKTPDPLTGRAIRSRGKSFGKGRLISDPPGDERTVAGPSMPVLAVATKRTTEEEHVSLESDPVPGSNAARKRQIRKPQVFDL